MDFKKEVEARKEEFLTDLKKVLSINSILDDSTITSDAPFGKGIRDCLDTFMDMAKKDGFETFQDGGYAGHVDLGDGDVVVGSLCHLDVVPVTENWDTDPFVPTIKDGKIYARGSMDDKGPLIAFYEAMKLVKESGIKFKNKIRLIVGTDEETGWRGLHHYWTVKEKPSIGISPDADFPLIYGEKGIIHGYLNGSYQDSEIISIDAGSRLNIVIGKAKCVTVHDHSCDFNEYLAKNDLTGSVVKVSNGYEYTLVGVSCHAMQPFKGRNAASYLCNFLTKYTNNPIIHFISKYFHLDPFMKNSELNRHHEYMGDLTCNLGRLTYDGEKSSMGIDIRYPKGITFDEFSSILGKIAERYELSLSDFTDQTPHYIDPEDDLVKGLYNIYVKHTNDNINKPVVIGGGTYARIFKRGVAFGMEMPGEPSVAHEDNEAMKLDNFFMSILIYVDAILFLGELDA